MANLYENYQIPYDFNQVNHYDYNYYHHHNQQQQFGNDPTSYNCYNWNESESEKTSASVGYSGFDPVSYNYYNWNESESENTSASVGYSGFDPVSYNYYNWNGPETETTSAFTAYSVSTMSEPKHLFYDPNLYTTYESPPKFSIYRSVATVQEFNEPEFEEYDPTPYDGGYDIVATYGKPRPPSVDTCYPSSTPAHTKPSPPEIITPVPLGIYDGGQKNAVRKRVTFAEPVEETRPMETIKEEKEQKDDDEVEEEDEVEEVEEDHSSSYGKGESEIVDKGKVKALYIPSGYGLEATDLCEVIFGGYFPCVLRNKRRQEDDDREAAVSCWDINGSDPWKTTSDYLFGDSYPYGSDNRSQRSQFDISSYGYQKY